MASKTLANHKANVRAALRWITGEVGLPSRGAPLTPEWTRLRDRIDDKGLRARLYGLMRFASARRMMPTEVHEAFVAEYLRYRMETTALEGGVAAHRSIARSWNRCADSIHFWPSQRLAEPALAQRTRGPEWSDFPGGLQQDIEVHVGRLAQPRKSINGKSLRPSKPSTLRTLRAELVAFARKAVEIRVAGVDDLTSFSALLHPNVVRRVLDAYWAENGPEPSKYIIELAWKLHAIARETGCLGEVELAELDGIRAALDEHRQTGLTQKNLDVIRQVLSGNVWDRVVNLPEQLMAEARELRNRSPVKAALRAQLAAGIAILTFAPVRVGNLTRIRLEENLTRPGGPERPYLLRFPAHDVKNRIELDFA